MQNTWKRRLTSQRAKIVLPAIFSPLLLLGCSFGTTMPTPFVVGEGPATVGKKQTRLDVGGGGIFPIGGTGDEVYGGAIFGYTGLSFWLGGPK